MPNDEAKKFCEISLNEIVSPQEAIHPCLDWVKGQLIVGVNLKDGRTGVLSSTRGLVRPEGWVRYANKARSLMGLCPTAWQTNLRNT